MCNNYVCIIRLTSLRCHGHGESIFMLMYFSCSSFCVPQQWELKPAGSKNSWKNATSVLSIPFIVVIIIISAAFNSRFVGNLWGIQNESIIFFLLGLPDKTYLISVIPIGKIFSSFIILLCMLMIPLSASFILPEFCFLTIDAHVFCM